MQSRVEALVKPELLVWAREDAGYSQADAARKVQVKPDRLIAWETGAAKPSIAQLRKLAGIYKRPLAVFYLSEPPKKFQAMHDFRRLPSEAGAESPELRYQIRRASYRRQVALDLFSSLGVEPPQFSAASAVTENPELVAARLRALLAVKNQSQRGWKNEYEALNAWREGLETLGILVFHITGVEVSEARGFSLSDRPLPVVAANIKDSVRGRIFTMLHEMAHLTLDEGGLCDLEEKGARAPADQRAEVFCNHVAGAVAVPEKELANDPVVRAHGQSVEWSDTEIASLARGFWVSREVIVRRLLVVGRTNEEFYRRKREQYQAEYQKLDKPAGFAPPYQLALSSAGLLFARLALESYYREKITSSDLSEFLDVRLKHIPKIEGLVYRRMAAGEAV